MNCTQETYPLEWIDDYVARLRDYVFVREEDCLLIKVPNEAHKLNESGVRILRRLLDGESALDLWRSHGATPEVRRDIYEFFIGLKQVLQGCVNEHRLPVAIVSRAFTLGFNTLPILSEVALTYRCNLSCRFCYASAHGAGKSCRRSDDAAAELSTDEVREILRVIREEAQVPSVSFTGGEPTLREDLPDLVRYARESLGLRVNLITNGTLIDDELADVLHAAGLNSAQVSIESNIESIHDRLTQVAGSYDHAIEGIRRLRALGISVHTNTTLNRLNLETAPQMPAFVKQLGLTRLSMNLVIPVGQSGAKDAGVSLKYGDIVDAVLRVQEEAKREDVEFMWYSPTPVCMFNPIQHRLGNKGCAACDGLLSVSPSGDVLPCSSWPEPVGNILRDGFRQVWDSVRARRLREKQFAVPMCQSCADFALCQGACPLYWKHFGYDELNTFGGRYVASTR